MVTLAFITVSLIYVFNQIILMMWQRNGFIKLSLSCAHMQCMLIHDNILQTLGLIVIWIWSVNCITLLLW